MSELIELYLIRHGIAAEGANYAADSERPLTDKGRRQTKKVADWLYELGQRFDVILTSPLVRARQTAEILTACGLSSHMEESAYLAPDGDINSWLNWLQQCCQGRGGSTFALVGHQPDLGNWAEILVWGESKDKLVLKKAGIIGLSLEDCSTPVGNSQLFLLNSPKWII